MKILILLAVVAALGLLRLLRANLLVWAGAWWVGIYILLRFGFTAPIPSSVITIYMGIVSIAILAYVSSSQERRDEVSGPLIRFMTDKRYTALLGATVVGIPARVVESREAEQAARFAAYAVVQEQTDPYAKAIQQLVEHSQELERALRTLQARMAEIERDAEASKRDLRLVK